MANRRMFSFCIINSAKFLQMPNEAQNLYFHLGLRADDDGVAEAYAVMRLLGATEDNLKILISKGFLKLLNEDLVVFITDWLEHNRIRADRKTNSIYKHLLEEKGITTLLQKPRSDVVGGCRHKAIKNGSLPHGFSAKIRREFLGDYCPICNEKMTIADDNKLPSVQHNISLSKGGEHEIENISIICKKCNTINKDKTTGSLNNDEVVRRWNDIVGRTTDGQRTDNGQRRLGKVRLGKVRLVKDKTEPLKSEVCTQENKKIIELTELLYSKVKENYSFLVDKKTDIQWQADFKEMGKINRIDGRELKVIKFIILWSQQDPFWKQNIRSVKKLRKQFDTLMVRAKGQVDARGIKDYD